MTEVKRGYVRPLDIKHGRIDLSHGSGGRAMAQLIEELFAAAFDNEFLRQGNDGALLPVPTGGRMVMAADAHVVSPLFFPGGDIGSLSVHGTINDVAVMGARPLWLSASFILEEGFPLADLKRIVESMAAAAKEAGVPVVTGDTKVVEQGKGDGVFITTTGVRVLRDPTRGGLATTLNEIARQSKVGMMLQEKALPVNPEVAAACEFLGLDPLYVANEGKLVVIVAPEDEEKALAALRSHPLGARATAVGSVHEDAHHFVQMTTAFGGKRIVDWLTGEQLPRIC